MDKINLDYPRVTVPRGENLSMVPTSHQIINTSELNFSPSTNSSDEFCVESILGRDP